MAHRERGAAADAPPCAHAAQAASASPQVSCHVRARCCDRERLDGFDGGTLARVTCTRGFSALIMRKNVVVKSGATRWQQAPPWG